MQSSTLSRTSSVASISSDDAARRTRKRFSRVQLMMLEQLFHQTSHPTREEREAVAQTAGMEMKSVTIWFQNKRQTERKVALHHATSQPTDGHRTAFTFPSSPPTLSASTSTSNLTAAARTHTRTSSNTSSHAHTPRRRITPPHARPSLDRIATRSESRLPPPRTPTRPHNPHASLWDNMPSSPLAPPASPPARDLIEFMGSHRTLEWACAAARLAGNKRRPRERERERERGHDAREHEAEDTEEDDIEAVTPEGSLGVGAAHAGRTRPRLVPPVFGPMSEPEPRVKDVWPPEGDALQDEDVMRAALALCGLGRRSA